MFGCWWCWFKDSTGGNGGGKFYIIITGGQTNYIHQTFNYFLMVKYLIFKIKYEIIKWYFYG